jgi:hypothetical protein
MAVTTGYDLAGGGGGGRIQENPGHVVEENQYETLPHMEDEVEPTDLRLAHHQHRQAVQLHRLREEEEDGGGHGVDDSVISAHHSGIYESTAAMDSNRGGGKRIFKDKILLSSDLGDETRL